MPNTLDTPIIMNAGSFSSDTSNMDARADLKEAGRARHGQRSYSVEGRARFNCHVQIRLNSVRVREGFS